MTGVIYLALWAILSLLKGPEPPVANSSPNILFLFADDMRYNSIHARGNDEIITPNLDQLSREGLYFNNFYVFFFLLFSTFFWD